MTTAPATFTGEIHWAAAKWPPLDEDEMRGLADDIKVNGLLDPIGSIPRGASLMGARGSPHVSSPA